MQSAFSMSTGSSADDRLEYLYLNLVGQLVMVHTIDGAVTEGLFLSRIDEDQHPPEVKSPSQIGGIILRHHRRSQSPCYPIDGPADLTQGDLLICYADIVYMEVSNLRIRTSAPGSGQVEGFRGVHDLKQLDWTFKEELLEGDDGGHGSGDGDHGPWDQFKENKQKFGVGTTYSEDHYTTKLNRNEFTDEQRRQADSIAEEIMKSQATHGIAHLIDRSEIVDADEGTLYSDVMRPGAEENPIPAGQRGGKNAAKANARGGGAAAGAKGGAAAAAAGTKGSRHEGREFNGVIPAAAAGAAGGDPAMGGAGGHSPLSSPNDFNPQAQPFLPSRPAFDDFIKAVASAIAKNEKDCFECPDTWPGDEQASTLSMAPVPGLPGVNGNVPSGMGAGANMHPGNNLGMQPSEMMPFNGGMGPHNMASGPMPQGSMPMMSGFHGVNNAPLPGMMGPHAAPVGSHHHAGPPHHQAPPQGGYPHLGNQYSTGMTPPPGMMAPHGAAGNAAGGAGGTMYAGGGRGAGGPGYGPNPGYNPMDSMGYGGAPGSGAGVGMAASMGAPMQGNNNNNNNNNGGGGRGSMSRQQKSTQPQQPVAVSSVPQSGIPHHNSPPSNANPSSSSHHHQQQHQATMNAQHHHHGPNNNNAGSPPPGSAAPGGSAATNNSGSILPNIDSTTLEKSAGNTATANNSTATHTTSTAGPQRKMRRGGGGGVRDEKKGK